MQELFTFPTKELLEEFEVVVSISLNSESNNIEFEANQIQFQNLLKEAKGKLSEKYDEKKTNAFLEKVQGLVDHTDFWRRMSQSAVFYITPNHVYFYRLSIPIHSGTVVSNQPYVLPLIANFQYVSYYHLLAINHDKFSLYNGRRNKLQQIDLPEDAPDTLTKALGNEFSGGEINVADSSGGDGGLGVIHGHNEKSDEKQIDQVNYFRAVDSYVYENYSKATGLPLVLFALTQNISDYDKLSKNEFLDKDTRIEASASQLSFNDIQDKTSEVVDDIINRRYKKLVDKFKETTPEFRLEAQYNDLAMASIQGKIDTLLLEDNYQVNGTIDENGQYKEGPETNLYVNQLVHNVLNTNGNVYVLENATMPSDAGIAATLRF